MKKIIMIAAVAMLCTMMCGCLEETPLTDEEMDIVAEYAADLLLKYDKNYKSSLLTKEELEALAAENATPTPTENPQATPSPTTAPGNPDGTTPVPTQGAIVTPSPENAAETNRQLTDVVGVDGFFVTYDYYETVDEVISNEYLSLMAKEGRQYIVLHFTLVNTTDQMKVFDASEQKLECSIDINLGTISRVSLSMLENDLQYMPIDVPAKGSAEAVLVFEISAKEKIETAHLIMMNKDENAVFIQLQ